MYVKEEKRCWRCRQWEWVHYGCYSSDKSQYPHLKEEYSSEFEENFGHESDYYKKYGGPCDKFYPDALTYLEERYEQSLNDKNLI